MKTFFLHKSGIILFSLLVLSLLFSCKKKEPTPTTTTPTTTGTLVFNLHTDIDTSEVNMLGQVYKLSTGRQISVKVAQLYISHIQLVKLDGTTYDVPNMIVLKRQQIEPYIIGNVPTGSYKSVNYYIGLDPGTDTYSASSDSVLNHPDMWFDSTGNSSSWGYRFINFQGTIDTSKSGQGLVNQMQPFQLKLAGPSVYREIIMPEQDFTVALNETTFVNMNINYAYLLNNITLTNPANLSIQNPGENLTGQMAMDDNITSPANANSIIPSAFITYGH